MTRITVITGITGMTVIARVIGMTRIERFSLDCRK